MQAIQETVFIILVPLTKVNYYSIPNGRLTLE